MAAIVPSSAEVVSLFRSLLKEARKFEDYNIREYVKRRTKQGFQQHKSANPEVAASAFLEGKEMLNVAKRQATIYSLYAPKVKSIMDVTSQDG
jgi:hypothetical protein